MKRPFIAVLSLAGLAVIGAATVAHSWRSSDAHLAACWKREDGWKALVARQSATMNEQTEALRRLTAATDAFFKARQ
jgi:hypothetical protein